MLQSTNIKYEKYVKNVRFSSTNKGNKSWGFATA